MIKRVNFTGRRRIPRDRVDIVINDGDPRTFDAALHLDDLGLPDHAAVFVEGMCAGSSVVPRFDFGRVGDPHPPGDRRLTGLDGDRVFFTLKVVDRDDRFGRILGIAENLRPKGSGDDLTPARHGILPVEAVDLKQELWRLDFHEHEVFLLVNKSVPGLKDRARHDPLFCAAVYPVILRTVLREAFLQFDEGEEELDRWPAVWLRFGKRLHPDKEDPPRGADEQEAQEEWVDAVVEAFCDAHLLRDNYVAALGVDEGDD